MGFSKFLAGALPEPLPSVFPVISPRGSPEISSRGFPGSSLVFLLRFFLIASRIRVIYPTNPTRSFSYDFYQTSSRNFSKELLWDSFRNSLREFPSQLSHRVPSGISDETFPRFLPNFPPVIFFRISLVIPS